MEGCKGSEGFPMISEAEDLILLHRRIEELQWR